METESTARGSNDPKPTVPEEEEEAYRSEDSEYDNVPQEAMLLGEAGKSLKKEQPNLAEKRTI